MQKSIPSVKTAVSIRQPLFDQVDKLAKELHLPRSQVFTLALEAYIKQHQNRQLLDQLNQAHVDAPLPKKEQQARRRSHRRIVEGEW
jgi:metal-responsive CopG/Arc/MetJ family transcriptional regulator